jgi:hypothetical protein
MEKQGKATVNSWTREEIQKTTLDLRAGKTFNIEC